MSSYMTGQRVFIKTFHSCAGPCDAVERISLRCFCSCYTKERYCLSDCWWVFKNVGEDVNIKRLFVRNCQWGACGSNKKSKRNGTALSTAAWSLNQQWMGNMAWWFIVVLYQLHLSQPLSDDETARYYDFAGEYGALLEENPCPELFLFLRWSTHPLGSL
jgi:hypothetical protein